MFESYLVEYVNFNGFASSRRFDGRNSFERAKAFFDRVGHADLLGLVKFKGYQFVDSK